MIQHLNDSECDQVLTEDHPRPSSLKQLTSQGGSKSWVSVMGTRSWKVTIGYVTYFETKRTKVLTDFETILLTNKY